MPQLRTCGVAIVGHQSLELDEAVFLHEGIQAEIAHLDHADRQRDLRRELEAAVGTLGIGAAGGLVEGIDLIGQVGRIAEQIGRQVRERQSIEHHDLDRPLGKGIREDRLDRIVDALAVLEKVGLGGRRQFLVHRLVFGRGVAGDARLEVGVEEARVEKSESLREGAAAGASEQDHLREAVLGDLAAVLTRQLEVGVRVDVRQSPRRFAHGGGGGEGVGAGEQQYGRESRGDTPRPDPRRQVHSVVPPNRTKVC